MPDRRRPGGVGNSGSPRPIVPEIPVETVVPRTMFVPSFALHLVATMPLRPTASASLAPPTRLALVAAAAVTVVAVAAVGRAVEVEPPLAAVEEAAFTDSPILELPAADAPALSVVPEELAAPAPIAAEVPRLGPPTVLDASARSADGMLLDQLELDEMPFEASSGRWFWNGGWYLGAESLWMHRSRQGRQVIYEDINFTGVPRNVIPYTSTGQPFNLAPGARITLGKSLGRDYLDRDQSLEMIYYGGMDWSDESGWNAMEGGLIYTPLNLLAPGFNGATRAYSTYRSDLNSLELNYKLRRRLGRDQLVMSPGGDWTRHAERGFLPGLIVGARLARVAEDFWMQTTRENTTPPTPPSTFGGFYSVGTDNWLLGLNLGAELISQNEFFYWGLRGRVAPAINFASTDQAANGVNNTAFPTDATGSIAFSDSASQAAASFIGDLTLMLGWNVTPNFSLQAGWDFLWVAGIATAERQFNLNEREFDDIDSGGQTFFNGLSFGFYGSW